MSPEDVSRWVPLRWSPGLAPRVGALAGSPINCVVVENGGGPPGIRSVQPDKLPGVEVLKESKWPSVKAASAKEGGPTGSPWVDANGWEVRLRRALKPESAVWVNSLPPANSGPADYQLAVADAAVYGARWVVDFGKANPSDDVWNGAMKALEFFEKHREWNSFQPVATLGVLSSFSGDDEYLSTEFLNLAARRQICFHVMPLAGKAHPADLEGLVYIGTKPLAGDVLEHLGAWVSAGHILIAPAGTRLGTPTNEAYPEYELRALGKGKVAVPKEAWTDPWQLVNDANLLISRRHDPLRVFNAGTLITYYTRSADGKRGLVQMLNYARHMAAHEISFGVNERWKSARLVTFEKQEPLKTVSVRRGVEVALPPLGVYTAIELEM